MNHGTLKIWGDYVLAINFLTDYNLIILPAYGLTESIRPRQETEYTL